MLHAKNMATPDDKRGEIALVNRVADDSQLDHLVAAIQEHASSSHQHQITREQVLADVGGRAGEGTGR
ncbi:MAG TPA: hypothetical protein VFH58_14170 [Acidimicrobiales bacterium]|nr:hypothetical protein [Acidimicrobiales bacterium]